MMDGVELHLPQDRQTNVDKEVGPAPSDAVNADGGNCR